MPLERQVTSLELSKRFKELGVKQESFFYWKVPESPTVIKSPSVAPGYLGLSMYDEYSAFTVAELLPWLNGEEVSRTVGAGRVRWKWFDPRGVARLFWDDNTDADALAGLVIYLVDQKIVTVEEINRRIGEQI